MDDSKCVFQYIYINLYIASHGHIVSSYMYTRLLSLNTRNLKRRTRKKESEKNKRKGEKVEKVKFLNSSDVNLVTLVGRLPNTMFGGEIYLKS